MLDGFGVAESYQGFRVSEREGFCEEVFRLGLDASICTWGSSRVLCLLEDTALV